MGPVDLHPWNRDFTWQAGAPPYVTLTAEQAAAFDLVHVLRRERVGADGRGAPGRQLACTIGRATTSASGPKVRR